MASSDEQLLAARVTVPEHVVRRGFAEEAIALNLDSGQYHGLNPSAAAMVDALEAGETGAQVAERLAGEFDVPAVTVRQDLLVLMRALAERGLIEIHAPGTG